MKYCFKQKINKNGEVTWYAYGYIFFNIKIPLYYDFDESSLTLFPNPLHILMSDAILTKRENLDDLKNYIITKIFSKGFEILKQKRIKQKLKNFHPNVVERWP